MATTGMYKDEIDILYAASNQLTQAATPLEQLQAVSDYAREHGAFSGTLFYIENDAANEPEWAEIVANWALEGNTRHTQRGYGERYYLPDLLLAQLLKSHPEVPYLVEDVNRTPQLDSTTRTAFGQIGARAAAILPLNSKGRWVGLLMFNWFTPQLFTERDQRIYTALMQQAAPVIDSVRLFEQTQKRASELESAKDETEILYSASNRLTRASTPALLLEAVSAYPRDNGAVNGQLFHFHQQRLDRMEAVATWGVNPKFQLPTGIVVELDQRPFPQYWLSRPEAPTLVSDVINDDLVDPVSRSHFVRLRTRGLALLPLYGNGRWIGVISFYWNAPHNFDARDERIFTALQQQLAPVVDSIQLSEQTQKRARELETVAKVSAAAARILDVKILLKTAIDLTQLNFTGYNLAIYLLDPTGQTLEKAASASADVDIPRGFAIPLNDELSLIAQAGYTRQSIIVNDVSNDVRYTATAFCKDTRSEMTIPMIVADKLIGILDVQSSKLNRFSETDATVMSMLADLIAVAIQNARLYEQAQELAALEERNRLARELHDSVSQALYGIALGARTARTLLQHDPSRLGEPLDYILSLAEAGLTEMRALIFDLRPESLENEGLITALSKQATLLQGRHGIVVQTDFCDEPTLPLEVKEMLYRIAREALHNTIKHAQASQVSLRLGSTPQNLLLEIIDNGHGFDANGSFPGHLGLHSMRERAARLNATLIIDSAPNQGTRISVQIPRAVI